MPSRGPRRLDTRLARAALGGGAAAACLLACAACGDPGAGRGGAAERPSAWSGAFVELAADAGLGFVHENGRSGEYWLPEIMGAGAALFDADGDGDLDAYLVQGGPLGADAGADAPTDRLFRNDSRPGRIAFTDVTEGSGIVPGGYGMGVAAGDVDADGDLDLYVTNLGPNRLYLNRGDGTFVDGTAASNADDPRWSVPAAFADLDADGCLDLYVGAYVDFRFSVHQRCRAGSGLDDYCSPLVYGSLPGRLLAGRCDGTFADVSRRTGLAAAPAKALGVLPADFDADGRIDLYVANDGVPNHLWMNRGGWRFEESALLAGCAVNAGGRPEASMGVDAADVDADGDEDLFMTHLAMETNTFYVNRGDGTFADATARSGLGAPSFEYTGFGTAFVDVDNDGRLDIVAVNGAVQTIEPLRAAGDPFPLHQPNQLFRNDGERFVDASRDAGPAFALSEVSRGAAFGDVDNDGDTDVLVANNGGPARLLVNTLGQDAAWIGVRLVDGAPPRDVPGAFAGLERDGAPTLWRRVRLAGSYASVNDPRIVFGTGGHAARGLVVRWPGGEEERFPAPPEGAYTTIVRGAGEPAAGGRP